MVWNQYVYEAMNGNEADYSDNENETNICFKLIGYAALLTEK